MTKKEIIVALKEAGVKFNSKATVAELEAMLVATTNDATAEQAAEEAAAEDKPTEGDKKAEKKQNVVYSNYTSKKNLLKDYPNMETDNNQSKIFRNGFTYSITEDKQYVAVTYYYSKGAFYKYGLAKLNEDMQVDGVTYKDSIRDVKAAIKNIYYPEVEQAAEQA